MRFDRPDCDVRDPNSSFVRIAKFQSGSGFLSEGCRLGTDHLWDYSIDSQRIKFFDLKEVRQAVAMCIDREALVADQVLNTQLLLDSYVPPSHPLYNPQVVHYDLDLQKAAALLESVGWQDADNDPTTPRTALGVAGVPDGTAFEVEYLVSSDSQAASRCPCHPENAGTMWNSYQDHRPASRRSSWHPDRMVLFLGAHSTWHSSPGQVHLNQPVICTLPVKSPARILNFPRVGAV